MSPIVTKKEMTRMNTITTVFVLLTALISTFAIILDPFISPFYPLAKSLEGKKADEFKDVMDRVKYLGSGKTLMYVLYYIISFVTRYFFVPFFIVIGITFGKGESVFGFIAIMVFFSGIFLSARATRRDYRLTRKAMKVVEDAKASGKSFMEEAIKTGEVFPKMNYYKTLMMQVPSFIPVLYLWYVFFVQINVIPTNLF